MNHTGLLTLFSLHLVELVVLGLVYREIINLKKGAQLVMKEIDDLQSQVEKNTSVEESAVTLIQGLAAQITAAGTDPAKLQAITAKLNTSASDLAAAVAANTPAAA